MNTKRLVSIAVFTALIAVSGIVSVPIPFTQVQLSFQTMFVIMAGALLGARDGAIAVLVYVAMGLLGLPVFTEGGGLGYVFKPSFGYLIGFPLGAALAGLLVGRAKKPSRGRAFVCGAVGMIPVYIIGMTYQTLILYYYMGIGWAATAAGLPALGVLFLKDAVLVVLVSCIYPSLAKALGIAGRGGRARRNVGDVRDI